MDTIIGPAVALEQGGCPFGCLPAPYKPSGRSSPRLHASARGPEPITY